MTPRSGHARRPNISSRPLIELRGSAPAPRGLGPARWPGCCAVSPMPDLTTTIWQKASPAPATAALDAALAALRRQPAPPLPSAVLTPPMTPAPAVPDGGKALPSARAPMPLEEWDGFHHLRHLQPAPRRRQLDHGVRTYWDFRDRIVSDIRAKRVSPTAAELVDHSARKFNLTHADAAEWTERFMHALQREIDRRRTLPGIISR